MATSCPLILLLLSWLLSWAASKEKMTVGVVLPHSSFFKRSYRTAILKATRDFLPSSTLKERYELEGVPLFADNYSPPELLKFFCDEILAKNMNAVLYLSNSDYHGEHTSSGQYVLQVSNYLGIPVIAWNGDNSGFFQPTTESIILQMAPSVEHQCRAMLGLLRRYNWKAFSIVTGSMAGEVHFVNNLRELAEKSDAHFDIMSVVHMPKQNEQMIREQLNKLLLSETRVILLYSSRKEAQLILNVANERGLTGKEFVWIVSQSIVGNIEGQWKSTPNEFPIGLFGIYFNSDRNVMEEAIVNAINVWAHGMNNLLEDEVNRPRLKNVSLLPNLDCKQPETMHWKNGRVFYDYLRNITIVEPGRPTISFNEDGIITDTELKIVNVNPQHEWQKKGQWNMRDGLQISDITWPGDMPTPPQGRPSKYHLKVVTIKESPYIIYSDPDPKTGACPAQAALVRIASYNETLNYPNATTNSSLYQCCSGLCIDLLKLLSEKIGFEYDLFQVEDRKFGAFDKEKGEWNGLVRALMDGKADMSMASLSITEERNQQIDFSVPFLETGITIIVAVRDGVISPTAFLEPFDVLSWVYILLICINMVAITLFLFEWLSPAGYNLARLPPREPYDYPSWCLILVFSVHASGAAIFIYEWLSPSGLDRGNKPIREHRFSLFRSFWLIWAMLFGAAVNTDNPRGVSSRFVGNIWALFAVVFTASYTANLAAFMITKEDYDRLTGIQDWRLMNPYSHKPPFKFATVPHGSTEANLRKNYPDMYRYMKPYNRTTVLEGVRAVKEHEINAFIYDATVLEYLAGHDDGCRLRTVGNWYAMTGYGLGFPHGSKWLSVINKFIVQFQHNGEMERLQKFWLAGACSQNREEGESSNALGILNFTSAFILLAGGMLLGGILLLLEHIYFKFFRRKLRKWDTCGCCGLVSLSMGKSLTFEQSVREALDMQRHHKCKNPVCETQLWKAKHELDLALIKIDRLQKIVGNEAAANRELNKLKEANKLKKLGTKDMAGEISLQLPAGGAVAVLAPPSEDTLPASGVPDELETISVKEPSCLVEPHAIGWTPDVLGAPWPAGGAQYPAGPAPDYLTATAIGPSAGPCPSYPIDCNPILGSTGNNVVSFKSQPASTMKNQTEGRDDSLSSTATNQDFNDTDTGSSRKRHHKGNVYIEVPDDPSLEKETVL